MAETEPRASVRADVWLWAARFFKTRSLAKQAIDGGKVDLNGAACKPSKAVHVGDRLQIGRGEERFEVVVSALTEQRGPASVAQALLDLEGYGVDRVEMTSFTSGALAALKPNLTFSQPIPWGCRHGNDG